MRARTSTERALALAAFAVFATQCFERGDRWIEDVPTAPLCQIGAKRCSFGAIEHCVEGPSGLSFLRLDDCATRDQVCSLTLGRCADCEPNLPFCDGQTITACGPTGEKGAPSVTCDPAAAQACRDGSCHDLCADARSAKSNVGCEYWAVDLDNAMIDETSNAAAQQFAVVVSNPQPDVPVRVVIEQDDTLPGAPGDPHIVAEAVIPPLNLEIFKLGPREVDGSPAGEFDTGTHTALTRHGYRVRTDFPVVAYQFNPLENVAVFSNDASLLYPTEALTYDPSLQLAYVVLGWPQTIAITDDPNTNFDPLDPINLRASLTIVATQDGTTVRVTPTTTVVGGGPVLETPPSVPIEQTLDAFDVLNLETGDFNADFTGSLIEADAPIAVFTGNEASDAPHFEKLSQRRCCADHLEEQLAPIRTAGKSFVVPHTPSRTKMVISAGATVEAVPEPDYVRLVAATGAGAKIHTTLPAPDDTIVLDGLGSYAEVRAYTSFFVDSDQPILIAQIMASQEAAGVRRGLPGGDPSLLLVPPFEQARDRYVFLTPDKYAFDYVTIVAPRGAIVYLDNQLVTAETCVLTPGDGLTTEARGTPFAQKDVYECQLGFATIDPSTDPATVFPGLQNDGCASGRCGRPGARFRLRLRRVRQLRVRGRHRPARDRCAGMSDLRSPLIIPRRSSALGAAVARHPACCRAPGRPRVAHPGASTGARREGSTGFVPRGDWRGS